MDVHRNTRRNARINARINARAVRPHIPTINLLDMTPRLQLRFRLGFQSAFDIQII
jgi:hypothetical protein